MANKRQDERINKMYEEYQKGFSLSEVGKMFGITRQSVYENFRIRSFKLRKKKELPYMFFNNKKYTLRNNGYLGKTDDKRTLMHRDVWEYYNGKIPKGYDIHHKDRDRKNNKIENLELMRKDEHTRKFATGNNQFNKKKEEQ